MLTVLYVFLDWEIISKTNFEKGFSYIMSRTKNSFYVDNNLKNDNSFFREKFGMTCY